MATIHGRSYQAIQFLRHPSSTLSIYWVYCSRTNNEGVAWPSLSSLQRTTGWNREACVEGRKYLVEVQALEPVHGYVRPQWRNLEEDERQKRINLDRSHYFRVTGTINTEHGILPLLYVPANDGTLEDEDPEDGYFRPSEFPTVDISDANLIQSKDLDPNKRTPKILSAAGGRLYGDYGERVPKVDRSATPRTDEAVSHKDASFPDIGYDIIALLKAANASTDVRLSPNMLRQLETEVATKAGVLPSPIEERRANPEDWKLWVQAIPSMLAWKKRIDEQKERLTPSKAIGFLRGYDWKGGWLEFRPREIPKPSGEANDWGADEWLR